MAEMPKSKPTDNTPAHSTTDKRMNDGEREQLDTTNPEALREAARLGTIDAFLVKTDLQDIDQREDSDQPDGRPSPMANADNPER